MTIRIRKAWNAGIKDDPEYVAVFYAHTAGKARNTARSDLYDAGLVVPFTHLVVRRAKHLDVQLPGEHRLVAELTPCQRRIVSHAFGCDSNGNGYRDHYCTSSSDLDLLKLAWEFGLFYGPLGSYILYECDAIFRLTELGKEVARSMLPTYVE